MGCEIIMEGKNIIVQSLGKQNGSISTRILFFLNGDDDNDDDIGEKSEIV